MTPPASVSYLAISRSVAARTKLSTVTATSDAVRASVTQVSLSDTGFFSGSCDLQTAVFFVAGPPNEGRVRFEFPGGIVSDEGDVFTGKPVLPLLFQSLSEPGVPPARVATAGWSEYMTIERGDVD